MAQPKSDSGTWNLGRSMKALHLVTSLWWTKWNLKICTSPQGGPDRSEESCYEACTTKRFTTQLPWHICAPIRTLPGFCQNPETVCSWPLWARSPCYRQQLLRTTLSVPWAQQAAVAFLVKLGQILRTSWPSGFQWTPTTFQHLLADCTLQSLLLKVFIYLYYRHENVIS